MLAGLAITLTIIFIYADAIFYYGNTLHNKFWPFYQSSRWLDDTVTMRRSYHEIYFAWEN